MTTEQQWIYPSRPLLALPASWPAQRDYRRAQWLARTLELEDCQAVFLDTSAQSAAWWYRWWFCYPLVYLASVTWIIFTQRAAPTPMNNGLALVLVCLLMVLFPLMLAALISAALRRARFHCEQIHLYANGFVTIDPRGRRQGASFDQLFDFRRGANAEDQPSGRLRWNIIRSAIAHPRLGQRPTLKMMPQLPDSTEICARIERGYTAFWLPRFREQFAAGETLDFDALLLQRDCLGKTTPGSRRFHPSLPRSRTPPDNKISVAPGMARGLITQTDAATPVEWLRRSELKSIRIDERFIFIRTLEPVRRDKQGRADRLWFQLDTLGLKDAAILREILPELTAR